ncbi:FHA domain-containing protein [Myxococcota bacterium]|nr:FHA domain-containing protein [Myxococcota bacterium]
MPPPSRRTFIVIEAPNGDVREVPVTATAVVIGRDESADIRVEDKKVSRRHAAFKLVDGEPWVEDLGSANGVKLNGKRIDKRARMRASDKVKVGGYVVTLKDAREETASLREEREGSMTAAPISARARDGSISQDEVTPSRTAALGQAVLRPAKKGPATPDDGESPVLVALDDPVKDQRFVLHSGENIIGRLEECDIAVLDGSVSRQHARVVFARDRISVTDLGSSNGSFVNEMRVEMAELSDGDALRIGNIRFRVELPPSLAKSTGAKGARGGKKVRPSDRGAEPASSGLDLRRLAIFGVVLALCAIAVLSYTIYTKLRARGPGEGRPSLFAVAKDADAGVEPVEERPDAGKKGFALDAGFKIDQSKGQFARAEDAGAARPDAAVDVARTDGPGVEKGVAPAQGTAAVKGVAKGVEPRAAVTSSLASTSTAIVYHFPPVVTATAPYSGRDADGVPRNLPEVDERFDFEVFVSEQLALATAIEAEGNWDKLARVLTELLERDPINREARKLRERLTVRRTATEAFERAEKLLAKGDVSAALKLYEAVPDGAPETPRARMRQEELRLQAIEQALAKADGEAKSAATWVRAHQRYRDVLALDAENTRALEGVRDLERKMRSKNLRFSAYVPERAKTREPRTPEELAQAIARMYPQDPGLAQVAVLYAQGSMSKATKQAEALEKKAEGPKKEAARRVRTSLKTIQQLYDRVRNETANDPNIAWAKLIELERTESNVLPVDVKSYVRRELEESVAEAFADAGASLFDREKLEEAFLRWDAGAKLDPGNPKLVAGLKKLEERAKQLTDEAELAAQRGERKVCDRFKAITHITRADSEVHKRALDRARQVCNP